ncbi:hypothetical protein D840_02420 [Enterococcus faecalis 20.SD.W.06]|nr:hypothetical protein D840_02420 [Enterococcus faecalis 20.SD.W.06]
MKYRKHWDHNLQYKYAYDFLLDLPIKFQVRNVLFHFLHVF